MVVVSLLAPLLKLEERHSYKNDYSRFSLPGLPLIPAFQQTAGIISDRRRNTAHLNARIGLPAPNTRERSVSRTRPVEYPATSFR